jgi:polyisoprenoid-binding protein YceI
VIGARLAAMSKTTKIVAAVLVVLVAVGGAGAWWFLRDDAPEEASLDAIAGAAETTTTGATETTAATESSDAAAEETTTTAVAETTAAPATDGLDGTWTIQQGDEIFAGYRIEELFAGDTIKITAVGRSTAVTGSLDIAGSEASGVSIVVDTTQIVSDSDRRDDSQRASGLRTDEFPEATFTVDAPIDISSVIDGGDLTTTVPGQLTLVGVTQPVNVELTARLDGDSIIVAGSTPIVLADFQIVPPTNPFVTVDENGVMEFQLRFARG